MSRIFKGFKFSDVAFDCAYYHYFNTYCVLVLINDTGQELSHTLSFKTLMSKSCVLLDDDYLVNMLSQDEIDDILRDLTEWEKNQINPYGPPLGVTAPGVTITPMTGLIPNTHIFSPSPINLPNKIEYGSPKPTVLKVCECGGTKANTTHATWCALYIKY